MNNTHLVDVMMPLVKDVDRLLLQHFRQGDFELLSEPGGEVVTDVDIQIEQHIVNYISNAFPGHGILGEETAGVEGTTEYQWLVDPIDGSSNFASGLPFFSCSLALSHRGETIFAIVSAPVLSMCFTAYKGEGAYMNGRRIHVNRRSNLSSATLATGFYMASAGNANLAYFPKIIDGIFDIRRLGSAALEVCLVAAGRLDGFWEFGLADYDIKAAELILMEAGGQATWHNMSDTRLVIASNCTLHQSIVKRLIETQ